MTTITLIDWDVLQLEWELHWSSKNSIPPNLNDHYHAFWKERGGRERYFDKDPNGKEVQRTHLRG